MAIVKLSGDPMSGPATSDVFYTRNGRTVMRHRPTPVNPRSEHQLRERAGMSIGQKSWGSLSSSDQGTWDGVACPALGTGYWAWVWISSLLGYVLEWIDTTTSDGTLDTTGASVDCSLDADAGTWTVAADTGSLPAGSVSTVRVARPMRPGRVPRATDMRTVTSGAAGSSVDVASAYVGRFGRLPFPDQVPTGQVRFANASTGQASCPVDFSCPAVGPCSCTASQDTSPFYVYSAVDISATWLSSCCSDPGHDVYLFAAAGGFSAYGSDVPCSDGVIHWGLADTLGLPRHATVPLQVIDRVTGSILCTASLDVDVVNY